MGENKTIVVDINSEPFKKLKKGIDIAADTVKETLGPYGKNIIINFGRKIVSTRDGVTVSKYIDLEDDIENIGAMAIKEASRNTDAYAGDGTTTATILTQAILNEAYKFLAHDVSPMLLRKSIEEATAKIIKYLDKSSRKIISFEELLNVSTISANNDKETGKIIAEAIHKVGHNGVITVERNGSNENTVSFNEGLLIERGYFDIFGRLSTPVINLENPIISILYYDVDKPEQVVPFIKTAIETQRPILLAVKKIEDSIIDIIINNIEKNKIKLFVINTPGINSYEAVLDFEAYTGATIFHPEYNPITIDSNIGTGTCKKAVIRAFETTIIEGAGTKKEERIKEIEAAYELEENETEKALFLDRLNKLKNSVASIKIFSNSDTEFKDKKFRIEDSINSTRAAASEGVVAGGGTALLASKKCLNKDTIGNKIMRNAIEYPIRTLIKNTGENADLILSKLEPMSDNHGYDAEKKEIANMLRRGILDPVKVTKTALSKAVSIATTLLTTGSCINRRAK